VTNNANQNNLQAFPNLTNENSFNQICL